MAHATAGRDAEIARLRGVLRRVEAAVARQAAKAAEAVRTRRTGREGPPARCVVGSDGVRAGLVLHGPDDPAPGAIELELSDAGSRIGLRLARRDARALAYALMRLADEAADEAESVPDAEGR